MNNTVVGWMEFVALPKLGLPPFKAKFDTGARTSALHATNITPFFKGGHLWVSFLADIGNGSCEQDVQARVREERAIKNTSGIPEDRYVIRTILQIGDHRWPIDLSLCDRTNMTFPMIIGRTALKKRNIIVHSRKTYLISPSEDQDKTALK